MKTIRKTLPFFLSVLIIASIAVIPAAAVTIEKDGKEYTFRSHTPTTGDVNVLAIRLGFADYSVDNEDYPAKSEQTLLSFFDGTENSVNGFYETSSYGKLRLHCDRVYAYNALHDRSEYESGSSLNDLFSEALTSLSDKIDFNDYDCNSDGELDIVFFDFAGPTGSWGETWWSHVSYDGDVTVGGKHLSTYSLLNGDVKTYMHEYGHILGAADYYSYEEGNPNVLMTFDMMSSKNSDHCGFNKWMYGWLSDDDIAFVDKANGDATVRLAPIETDLGDGRKIAAVALNFDDDVPFLSEFFLVEYDSGINNNKEVFEEWGTQPGFRIFHVNADANYNDGTYSADFVNNNNKYMINLIHSVKNEYDYSSYYGYDGAFFREGDSLTSVGYPNTGFSTPFMHNGLFTGISFTDFVTGDEPSFKVSFSDGKPQQTDPELFLKTDSLTSDINMTLSSDIPIKLVAYSVENPYSEERIFPEKPYLTDAEGNKLTLDVTQVNNSSIRLKYLNSFPPVEPEKEYTLVIPEGTIMAGYGQVIREFRQTIKTEKFLPLTTIESYSQSIGKRVSGVFAVTDNTYGRIELDSSTQKCVFSQFNLNGEEISRTTFDAPAYEGAGQKLFRCEAYRLNDGNFALCIFSLYGNYFTKIDKNGKLLSDTYIIDDEMVAGYVNSVENIKFDLYKDGLCKLLVDTKSWTAKLLAIDFKNEPHLIEASDNEIYISLDSEHYIRKLYHDEAHHIYVYDGSDNQTADIICDSDSIFLGAYFKEGKIGVLTKTAAFDQSAVSFKVDLYDTSGKKLSTTDYSANAGYIKSYFSFDRVIPTDSGFYLVLSEEFEGTETVIACDSEWNMLGKLSFDNKTDLAFLGECGLTVREQFVSDDYSSANFVSRFNIGDFEIVPNNKQPILGDVNGDGEVTIDDAACIQKRLVCIPTEVFFEEAADADEDGELSVNDVTAIQKWLVKLPSNDNIGKTIAY